MLLKPLTKVKPRIMSARAAHPRSFHLAQTFSHLSSLNNPENFIDKPIFLSNIKQPNKKNQNPLGKIINIALKYKDKEKNQVLNKRNKIISKLKSDISNNNFQEQVENKFNQETKCCGSPALWLKKPNKTLIHMALPEAKEYNVLKKEHNSNASTFLLSKTNYPQKFSTAKYSNFGFTLQNIKERSVIGEEIVR